MATTYHLSIAATVRGGVVGFELGGSPTTDAVYRFETTFSNTIESTLSQGFITERLTVPFSPGTTVLTLENFTSRFVSIIVPESTFRGTYRVAVSSAETGIQVGADTPLVLGKRPSGLASYVLYSTEQAFQMTHISL